MVDLYIIVHPGCFEDFDITGTIVRKKEKLEALMKKEAYLIIDDYESKWAREMHPDMPIPHDNLQVIVVGAYYKTGNHNDWCINNQLKLLKSEGYNVKMNKALSLPDRA